MHTNNRIVNGKPALAWQAQAPAEIGEIRGVAGHQIQPTLGRPSASTVPITLNQKLCRLDDLLRNVIDEVSSCHSNRLIGLHLVTNGCDPHCEVDPVRMHRAFRELVNNSFKSQPFLQTIQLLFFDTEITGQSALGIIYRENATCVVNERLDRSLARSSLGERGGTGLILTIVRHIVEAHGGEIVIRDTTSGGVEAVITLPRSEATFAL
ncbi:MAG: sensor histidine kinase [Rubripirellula sp.]